ncbi:hypothetical protein [Pseudonocardia phyllosphaerae]|uniref:hypothetical protein n=1 Tax=Pseudonocardia phyllosphaerae TaxID=3390502 RepID=UPI0039789A39
MTTYRNSFAPAPGAQPWPPAHYWTPTPAPRPGRAFAWWALGLAASVFVLGSVTGFVPVTVLLWVVSLVVAIVAVARAANGRAGGQALAVVALVVTGVAFFAMVVGSALHSTATAADPTASAPITNTPARAVTDREWQLIARDADAHRGERIIVHGEVTQADSVTGTSMVLAQVSGQPSEYPDSQVALNGGVGSLVEGDRFTAEVMVDGTYDYTTVMRAETSVPDLQLIALR